MSFRPSGSFVARVVQPALLAAIALSMQVALTGCKVEIEPAVRYEGEPRNVSQAYTDESLYVQSRLGNVRVVPGDSADVEVTFEPFILEAEDNEDGATAQLRDMLNTEVFVDDGVVHVQVFRNDGASGNLGADVIVRVPSTFDGAFQSETDLGDLEADFRSVTALTATTIAATGDIAVFGAAGPLSISTDLGDVDLDISSWAAADGVIHTDNGDVSLVLPADADGSLTAFADGPEAVVVEPSPLPADWAMAESAANAKSFTFGSGEGAQVDVDTGLGDIIIEVR